MVRHFVALKARLTWNGVLHDVQRKFGFPIATVLLSGLGLWLAIRHHEVASTIANPEALSNYMGWAALFVFAAWITLPVIIFPLDENLDPQQLAVLPITRGQTVRGLTAAALVAPATVVPVALSISNGVVLSSGWWMAIPASIVFIAMLMVGSQLFSSAISAILRTRRGRDIATFLVLGLAAASFGIYRTVALSIETVGIAEAASASPIADWALVIPPVAAQRAVVEASLGNNMLAIVFFAAAVVGLLLMARLWQALLDWMLTTPEQRSRPARRSRRLGMASGAWGVVSTLAKKELRFYVRDPRQRLVWTGTVIFVGLAVAGTIMGATGFFDIRDNEWAPLIAPILVLFVGLPIALNQFGWERNAASYLFVLPAKSHQLLLGKNVAVSIALVVETLILALGLSAFTGHWRWTWMALPLMVAAIGCQLAVGNFASVLTPLRLPREGTDVFAQSTEQGCLAIVSQVVSFFAIGLLLVVPASVTALTVGFSGAVSPLFTSIAVVAWGVVLYSLSLLIAGRLLSRRLPEVMAWVQVT